MVSHKMRWLWVVVTWWVSELVRFSVTLSAFYHWGMEMEKFLDEWTPFQGASRLTGVVEFAFSLCEHGLCASQADDILTWNGCKDRFFYTTEFILQIFVKLPLYRPRSLYNTDSFIAASNNEWCKVHIWKKFKFCCKVA